MKRVEVKDEATALAIVEACGRALLHKDGTELCKQIAEAMAPIYGPVNVKLSEGLDGRVVIEAFNNWPDFDSKPRPARERRRYQPQQEQPLTRISSGGMQLAICWSP